MWMDAIDWDLAQRIGELIAGNPPPGELASDSVAELTQRFAERVSSYAGLHPSSALPTLEAVDRPRWIAANLKTMRPLLEPLAARGLAARNPAMLESALSRAMRSASGVMLGAQVGALTGMLSQRVLGQYDIELLNPTGTPRLLLVAPNLGQAARNLQVDRDQLTSWVAIHEVTHAVQFSGAPWLQGHLAGLLRELVERMQVSVSASEVLNGLRGGDLGTLVGRIRRGEMMRITLGEARWTLVERVQSAMSLIEGHAEHVMDAVGAEVLPSLARLRQAMTRRRETRSVPWRVLERLLGIELKLRQYEVGRRYCDAVVARGGPEMLTRAFQSPESMPSAAELERPDLWLARMA
jgi:coenzyme F420 biosynthesis associated uncharacterized protein